MAARQESTRRRCRIGAADCVGLGAWFELGLRVLLSLRWLRGTAFDPFGRTTVRRVERELVLWYEELVVELARRLESIGVDEAATIADIASTIRGYEGIKLERAGLARERVEKALEAQPGT